MLCVGHCCYWVVNTWPSSVAFLALGSRLVGTCMLSELLTGECLDLRMPDDMLVAGWALEAILTMILAWLMVLWRRMISRPVSCWRGWSSLACFTSGGSTQKWRMRAWLRVGRSVSPRSRLLEMFVGLLLHVDDLIGLCLCEVGNLADLVCDEGKKRFEDLLHCAFVAA